ncbi:aquaporin-like protein [Lenzites betulinus]|nr:aquaporin-like protein [Lenzites betulinus]
MFFRLSRQQRTTESTPDPNFTFGTPPPPSYFATIKDDACAAMLEYVGTTFFLLLAYGGTQASQSEANSSGQASNIERDMYISLCFGFSLLSAAWLFYRVTGGLFNPNVSLALLLTGIIGPVRFVLYCIAQLLGGVTAAAIVLGLTPGSLASNTFLSPGINRAQGVFIEMFITTALVLAILMLAAEKHNATPFAPVGIGLTLFVCHLWAVPFTGAGMNTARSFGPAVVTGFPYDSHWVYWLGPFLGSLLASAFYAFLKHVKYWRFNPGQDTVDFRDSPEDPVRQVQAVVRRSISSVGRGRSGSRSESGDRLRASSQYSEKPLAPNESAPGAAASDVAEMRDGEASRGRLRPNDSAV